MPSNREPLPIKADPTHVLRIEIPMRIEDGKTFYFDPMQDAVRLVLALSRLATIGVLCGDAELSIEERA